MLKWSPALFLLFLPVACSPPSQEAKKLYITYDEFLTAVQQKDIPRYLKIASPDAMRQVKQLDNDSLVRVQTGIWFNVFYWQKTRCIFQDSIHALIITKKKHPVVGSPSVSFIRKENRWMIDWVSMAF